MLKKGPKKRVVSRKISISRPNKYYQQWRDFPAVLLLLMESTTGYKKMRGRIYSKMIPFSLYYKDRHFMPRFSKNPKKLLSRK